MTTSIHHVTHDGALSVPNDEALATERHAHWERLVDAGLIGNTPAMSDEARAQLEAADALFRRIARDRRRAQLGW